eukprot:SAG11_NODE_11782_length_738_cov_1.524257_2_plen_24_part_01
MTSKMLFKARHIYIEKIPVLVTST